MSSCDPRLQPFGLHLGAVFLLNSAVGSGLTQLPAAYIQGGWTFALVSEVAFLAIGLVMGLQLLEINERVKFLYRKEQEKSMVAPVSLWGLSFSTVSTELRARPAALAPPQPAPSVTTQFDLVQMVKIVLGKEFCTVFLILLAIYIEGALITFIHVFGNAMVSVTGVDYVYYPFAALFLGLMLYFCLAGLKRQANFQSIFTALRLGLVGCIGILSVWILGNEGGRRVDEAGDLRDAGLAMGVMMFAGMFHVNLPTIEQAIPALSSPATAAIMRYVHSPYKLQIVRRVSICLLLVYPLTGLLASFADTIDASDIPPNRGLVRVLIFLIAILPAFVSVSVFPIYVSSMSDNLLAFLYGPAHKEKTLKARKVRLMMKLLCFACPFAYCFSSEEKGRLAGSLGTIGCLVSYFTINLLHFRSRRQCQEVLDSQLLSWWPAWLSAVVAGISLALFAVLLYSQIEVDN